MDVTVNLPGMNQAVEAFSSCAVKNSNVDNWLRLPYVEREGANSLHISITFTMRQCSRMVDTQNLVQCKETFNLYYFAAEGDFGNDHLPSWDTMTYKKVDTIAAENTFQSKDDLKYNYERQQIALEENGPRGVYFAIQDQGACLTIARVVIYYVTCPNITINYAFFEETPTAARTTSIVEPTGRCVEHATEKSALSYVCQNDGQWYKEPRGECVCKPGHQGNPAQTECTACPIGQYKWSDGEGPCSPCPRYSYSTGAAAECTCQGGYLRSPRDAKSEPCTRPPSRPQNLRIVTKTPTSVTLTWEPPYDLGGRSDLTYRVACDSCSSEVIYVPAWRNFNSTTVTLNDLMRGRTYNIQVFAENGVTGIDENYPAPYRAIVVATQSIGKVINVRMVSMGPKRLTIAWDIPDSLLGKVTEFQVRFFPREMESAAQTRTTQDQNFTLTEFMLQTDYVFMVRGDTNLGVGEWSTSLLVPTGQHGSTIVGVKRISVGAKHVTIAWDVPASIKPTVVRYQVVYYPRGQRENEIKVYTQVQNLTITEFMLDTDYEFLVRCEGPNGWGDFSSALRVRTASKGSSSTPIGIIVGSIVAVILCMAIATIMIIILLRRNRPNCSEKKDCDAYSHADPTEVLRVTMPLFPSPGSVHSSVRTYVDPHTYEDPNQAVREFTREIDACHITIESVIGGGEFGDVCKGKLRMPGRLEMTVAIKTLKPGATEKNRLDFLTEASIMGQFDDPNVIFLEGVVTKSNPIMIVTEYMANGSLDTFLRNNDGKFTIIQLVGMMRGVASGMKYLCEMGFVHRDLAARNILVNEGLVCKVADFGLSREIESDTTDGAYTTKGGKIPVRWTAPEAIAFRKFTSASDVWSYGVVMWEIVSYGERPYYNWSNQDVIKAVEKGYRLPPPMDCPEAIHQLMLDCWQKERSHRPKLTMIVKTLDKLIRAPELLRKQAKPRPHNFIDPSTPDMTSLSTVEDWLVSIKMEKYLNLFLAAGLTTMEQVRHLTVRDLLNMGISLVGHQKKIMNSIQTFRAQTGEGVSQNVPEAALV